MAIGLQALLGALAPRTTQIGGGSGGPARPEPEHLYDLELSEGLVYQVVDGASWATSPATIERGGTTTGPPPRSRG